MRPLALAIRCGSKTGAGPLDVPGVQHTSGDRAVNRSTHSCARDGVDVERWDKERAQQRSPREGLARNEGQGPFERAEDVLQGQGEAVADDALPVHDPRAQDHAALWVVRANRLLSGCLAFHVARKEGVCKGEQTCIQIGVTE